MKVQNKIDYLQKKYGVMISRIKNDRIHYMLYFNYFIDGLPTTLNVKAKIKHIKAFLDLRFKQIGVNC
jgi:hypothetical protein